MENIKVYRIFINENDYVLINTRDDWDPCYIQGPQGTHIKVDTDKFKKIGTGKYRLLSGKEIYKTVPVTKDIAIYAIFDGNSFYEMVTGKDMKLWKKSDGVYDLDKYIYYAKACEVSMSEAAGNVKFVTSNEKRIKQYIDGLMEYEKEARDKILNAAIIKEAKESFEEEARQYIYSYKRPQR